MRLEDFERVDDSDFPRFLARVADRGGMGDFELRVAGPRAIVERMFADATIDLTIDSTYDDSQVRRVIESRHEEYRRSMWELVGFDDIDQLLKPSPRQPDRESSVFVSIRPVSVGGTPFVFIAQGFYVPAGVSIYLWGSWVSYAAGFLQPIAGDQDLYLHPFFPVLPPISSSVFSGTALDAVMFRNREGPFLPVFRVFGFTAGVCRIFTAVGV